HCFVARVAGLWNVRRRQQAPFERLEIELLISWNCPFDRVGFEKFTQDGGINLLMIYFFVVGSIGHQELFILSQEWGGVCATIIPNQNDPAARTQDPDEFFAASFAIKPMKGLAGSDE